MARVVGLLAGVLWVAGIATLVVGIRQIPPDLEGATLTRESGGAAYSGVFSYDAGGTIDLLTAGVVLVGVAGLLVGAAVARYRSRSGRAAA